MTLLKLHESQFESENAFSLVTVCVLASMLAEAFCSLHLHRNQLKSSLTTQTVNRIWKWFCFVHNALNENIGASYRTSFPPQVPHIVQLFLKLLLKVDA